MVKDTLAKMLAGEFNRFDVFTGPINDNQGNVVLPAGQSLEQVDLDPFPPNMVCHAVFRLYEVVG